jgi:hypothetical protein
MISLTRPSKTNVDVPTVWIVNVNTGRQRQLQGQEIASSAWSPDGATIAVTTEFGIGVTPSNGRSAVRELISPSIPGWHDAPAWCR